MQLNLFANVLLGAPIAQRWVFAAMGFLALVMAYGMRVSLSVAITIMAKPINLTHISKDETCPIDGISVPNNVTTLDEGTYEWDEYTQVRKTLKMRFERQ